jgi:DNA polymerase-4
MAFARRRGLLRTGKALWELPNARLIRDRYVRILFSPFRLERSGGNHWLKTMSEDAVRKIIHVDMDAFYASVEQRDNPELRGRPVAVGGSRARGVVAAASYEARKFGVHSAMPSVTALRRCPDLVFVKPRFEHYRAISRQVREVFAEYTPLIEPLSLDEAYLDVTFNLKQMPSATLIAQDIRAAILERTGLTASAGVSYNKFLAKLASDYRKPNGQYVITPAKGPAFVEVLEVAKFHGVGPVTAAKMNRLGIFTGADLRRQSLEFLQHYFGKAGPHFYAIARGLDDRPVVADRERKSIGSETTFSDDLTDPAEIEAAVAPLASEVWDHCARAGIAARTVTLKVKYHDFQLITRSRTNPASITDRPLFDRMVSDLVHGLFPLPKSIRLLGVSLHNLEHGDTPDNEDRQLTLNF